jgi:hypothetical protein
VQDQLSLPVLFRPEDPAIYAHYRVIKIYAGLSQQGRPEAEINIDDRIDKPGGIYPDIFPAAEPNAENTCEYGDEFQPGSLLQVSKELQVEFV